jgi:hypothetical protein
MPKMRRISSVLVCLSMFYGCAGQSAGSGAARAIHTTSPFSGMMGALLGLPTPEPTPLNVPPKILAVQLSPSRVKAGDTWNGDIMTTTNVASLEVRTPSFQFNARRIDYGEFNFSIRVPSIPPQSRRLYAVVFTARNPRGIAAERNVQVDFR